MLRVVLSALAVSLVAPNIAHLAASEPRARLAQGTQSQEPRRSSDSAFKLGPLMRFARGNTLPPAADASGRLLLELRPITVRSADDRRIRIEGMIAEVRVSDPARFNRVFSDEPDKMRPAAARIQIVFEDELRRAIGRLTLPELRAYDPLGATAEGTRLRQLLDQMGLSIDDIVGEGMGYRTLVVR